MHRLAARALAVLVLLLASTSRSEGTWSIILADEETREVAVGTVTCLTSFDLLAIVPVVVVGKGGGAVQAAGDFAGTRRPVIFDGLVEGMSPEEIFEILEGFSGHQQRQYGIVDTQGRELTFTGSGNGAWAGGVVGAQGTMHYAIQGNVLAGACVVDAIETAVLETDGDFPAKLMAGMEAARATGGDGRCSCNPSNPTACGCPPPFWDKSGHIGGMIVARIGDTDDPVCSSSGCADGDYLMRLNVAFQSSSRPDPVLQLQALFDEWRAELVGRPDAVRSGAAFDPPFIPANGTATTTMTVTLRDWQELPIDVPIAELSVEHAPGSAGLSSIGKVTDNGDGTFDVVLTAGTMAGVDLFTVVADDGMRPVTLMPEPRLRYFEPGDIDGDGSVGTADLVLLLAAWGPCPPPPAPCPADLDGDGVVDTADLVILLSNWG